MGPRYRFHEFELLPAPPFLLKAGEPVAVSSQVLILLRTLVERRGELVSKAEIAQAVWGHGHQSDAALARAIMRTRRLLGDDGEEQRFIRTVHGRGLIFVAPVEPAPALADPAQALAEAAEPGEPTPNAAPTAGAAPAQGPEARNVQRGWPAWPRASALLAVLLLACAVAYRLLPVREADSPVAQTAERVLLLAPIESPPDDDEADALASALPDALSRRLAPLGLRLTHALEAGLDADPASFGEALAVPATPSGAAGTLRLQLERTPAGLRPRVLLEGLAAGSLELPPAPSAELLPALGEALQRRLSGGAPREGSPLGTDPLLSELELRAHVAWARGERDTALRAVEAALALRPDYWPLQLLEVELRLGTSPTDTASALLQRLDAIDAGADTLQRALLLQRAGVSSWYAGDAPGAQLLLEAALEAAREARAPLTEALSRNSLSMALQSQGAIEEAWTQAELAVEALRQLQHPYHLTFALTNLAYLAEERGRLDRAAELHAEALSLRQDYRLSRLVAASQYGLARIERRRGHLLQALERASEAEARMRELGQSLDRVSALEELAVIALLRGRFDASEAQLDTAAALAAELEDALGQAWLMDVRGRLRLAQDRVAEAIPLLERALALQEQQGELNEARYSQIALLDARLRQHGETDPRVAEWLQALEELRPALSHDQRAALANVELRHLRRSGQSPRAEVACRQALANARTSGAADHEAEAALECALLFRALGRDDEAETLARVARSWSSDWYALAALEPEPRPASAQ